MNAIPMVWYPTAATKIACGEERHTIQWEAGNLMAPDHADPEGERALAALGGTRYACIDVLDAWARRGDDPRLLSALTRGPGDPVNPESDSQGPRGRLLSGPSPAGRLSSSLSQRGRGWVGFAPMSRGGMVRSGSGAHLPQDGSSSFEDDVILLACLGRSITMRLVATVTARLINRTAADHPEEESVRPALEASVFGRAADVLRNWVGEPNLEIELDLVEPGGEALSFDEEHHTMRVALPLQWVSEVWGRDLALLGGFFALALVEAQESRTTLATIGSDLGPARLLTIELG
jgi:hypothetical protein